MAKMIPALGPKETGSVGEETLYSLLERGLSDDFTVIHSLPWLSAAVAQMAGRGVPTGEIDFVILHPQLGVLVLEVKSGVYRVSDTLFVHLKTNTRVDVVAQTRKNFHGLTRALGGQGVYLRCGYGFVFPDSQFGDALIHMAMVDVTVDPPGRVFIDRGQMPEAPQRIIDMMRYWKSALGNPELGPTRSRPFFRCCVPHTTGRRRGATGFGTTTRCG